jgi:hypothetical protein
MVGFQYQILGHPWIPDGTQRALHVRIVVAVAVLESEGWAN